MCHMSGHKSHHGPPVLSPRGMYPGRVPAAPTPMGQGCAPPASATSPGGAQEQPHGRLSPSPGELLGVTQPLLDPDPSPRCNYDL